MGSLRRVVSKSADIAATAITQDVVDLVLRKTDCIVGIDPKLGSLECKVCQVTSVPVVKTLVSRWKTDLAYLQLPHSELLIQTRPLGVKSP